MKHILTTLLLLMLAYYVYAQDNMYGLAFGDNFAHSDSLMQQMGLSTKDKSGITFTYYPLPESQYYGYLNRINLYLDKYTSLLSGWVGYYNYPEGKIVQEEMLAAMTKLHGENYKHTLDDFYSNPNVYTWQFDKKHFAKIGDSRDVYYVWYYTE